MTQKDSVSAAVLVIGDEILSGRTRDTNSGHIADTLFSLGVDLREIRVVGDDVGEIAAALNALRARFDYVFTTGGIGPTHDDVTADAVGAAFGVEVREDERAIAMLLERVRPQDLNEARRRMARIPLGAELIENDVSKAPGFWIGNVVAMAGVPAIMKAMLDRVAPKLDRGARQHARVIAAGAIPEGAYAAELSEIAQAYPELSIGSYPSFRNDSFHNEIVARGRDDDKLAAAAAAIESLLERLRVGGADQMRTKTVG
ncbi:competence/damage-inducible protein A [Methylocella sp.]|uniref:competence/damage-inducible protein A n=1 Tax=Methylocella sp. TaxID=1978226 RepID=UPI003782DA36